MTEGRDTPGDDEAPAPTEPDPGWPGEDPGAPGAPGDSAEIPPSAPPVDWVPSANKWVMPEPARADPRALPPVFVPLKVASVFGRTLDTFLRHWIFFVVLAIPSAAVGVLSTGLLRDSTDIGLSLLVALLGTVIGVISTLSMMIATDDLRGGREATFDAVIPRALGRTIPALLSGLAEVAAVVGLILVPVIVALVMVASGGAGAVIGVVLLIATIIGVAIVSIRWLLSQAAIALDGFGPIQGLSRSWVVTRRNAWRLFAVFFLLGLIFLPLTIGITALSLDSVSPLLMLVIVVSSLIESPLSAIALATAYGDLTGRPAVEPVAGSTDVGRGILIAAVLMFGAVALVVGVPRIGPGLSNLALAGVPVEDRGKILVGTEFNFRDPCKPSGVKATFTTSDTLYIGGYFTKAIPPGGSASVDFYIGGTPAGSTPVGSATQMVGCYYELEPRTGIAPGTYRLVVTYGGETIAEGAFTVR
jgi:hypothetical protein